MNTVYLGMEDKPFKGHGMHDQNIFTPVGIEERQYSEKEVRETWVNEETGEIASMVKPTGKYLMIVDTLPFVKVFQSGIIEAGKLSIPAYRMYQYILNYVKPNTDWLIVNVDDFLDTFGYAPASTNESGKIIPRNTTHYYKAITELLNKQFICKKARYKDAYFINVNKFFNGDRRKLK